LNCAIVIAGLYEHQGMGSTLYYEGNGLRRTGYATGSLLLRQPLPGIYWGSDEPARSIHTSGDAIIVTFGNQQVWAFSEKR
jgi:hypothetical protein